MPVPVPKRERKMNIGTETEKGGTSVFA